MTRAQRHTNADRVLRHLRQTGEPRSAYQILAALRPEGFGAPMTVYRALEQLEAAGRVHRIESLNAWAACCRPAHSEAPVFLICQACGAVTETLDHALANALAALSARAGFTVEHTSVEIQGRCAACIASASAA